MPVIIARSPIALEGIGKRVRDERPVNISHNANNIIPMDTTPMVI